MGLHCKPCAKIYQAQYRAKPGVKERIRARVTAYQEARPNFKQEKQLYDIGYRLKNAERRRARNKIAWERDRDKTFRQKYGISVADYDEMFEAQSGLCAICGNPPNRMRLAVDHSHDTGQVRGLLCFNCNHGLGHFKDNPTVLRSAAEYLSRNIAPSRIKADSL